jgi:hypothetical protein
MDGGGHDVGFLCTLIFKVSQLSAFDEARRNEYFSTDHQAGFEDR